MQLIDQVCHLVREVAQTEVMPRFLRVWHKRKEDGSMLTEADLACQAALAQRLVHIVDYPVLGEEMSPIEQHALWDQHQGNLWVVDPIDGTSNFINGVPYFAISVALMKQGRSQLGVIYNPASGELFSAQSGQGAFMNGLTLPLRQSVCRLSEALAGLDVKSLGTGALLSRLIHSPPFCSQRHLGASTLDWCYLATGRYDVYLHGGQKLWDYAAGAVILEEAGGRFTTLEHDCFWVDPPWIRSVLAARDTCLFDAWYQWIHSGAAVTPNQ